MTKTLADIQELCTQKNIVVPIQRRPAKEPYLHALRDHFWNAEHPGVPLPEQIEPMLLGDWNDLDENDARAIEPDNSSWCVQEKLDGVRVLLHITSEGVRVTGRNISEVKFRLSEFTDNLSHLKTGFGNLVGTILDGELICPKAVVDTGETTTRHSLQATVAILATTSENAAVIQQRNDCRLRFMVFDVIQFQGENIMTRPLRERLSTLDTAFLSTDNPYLDLVETHTEDKALYHELLLTEGKEGSVWKRLDQPYETGKRVRHWLKRKKGIEVEATVTGFKTGTIGKGNADLIGAVEFSATDGDGIIKPIAWVSSWTDEERREITQQVDGTVTLNPVLLGKRAVIGGLDIAARSGRIRHAKLIRWAE